MTYWRRFWFLRLIRRVRRETMKFAEFRREDHGDTVDIIFPWGKRRERRRVTRALLRKYAGAVLEIGVGV